MATVNGSIQKDSVTGLTRGNFGSSGINNLGLSETGGISTGWISGGLMTAIGDAAPDITAGTGYIYVTASDSYTRVAWNAVSNLTVTNNAVNYISVNSAGVVSATVTPPSHSDQRTAIQLGRVSMNAGVISGITSTVVSIKQTAPQLYDLFKALGTVKSGLAVTAVGGNLKIAVASGEIYSQGVSGHTNVNNPNEAEFTGNSPQTFRMFTQTGVSGGDVTDLPVGSYDNAGTVTAIPGVGTQATLFTVYKFSSGNVRTFYGQAIYANLNTAVAAASSYVPVVPASFADAIIIGYIAATKNATDLSIGTQATFISTNRFGGIGGAVASAGSFMFTDFSNATGTLGVLNGGTGTTTSTGTGSVVLSASPTFTGTPLSTTAAPGTNTTQVATTAFVAAGLALKANLTGATFTGNTKVSYAMGVDDGFQVQSDNLTQGLSLGYNTIKASGTDANQNVMLTAKGTGIVNVTTGFQVNGTTVLDGVTNAAAINASGTISGVNQTMTGSLNLTNTNIANNGMSVRFNSSNTKLGLGTANSNGFSYLANNVNSAVGVDEGTYDINGAAGRIYMAGGGLTFDNAPSGTAGNPITWTTRLNITSAGVMTTSLASATTAVTQSANDNSTKVATTAYVDALNAVSGTYTPTISSLTNATGPSVNEFSYQRVGNIVSVSGSLSITVTSSATLTEFAFTLPIASNFSAGTQLHGVGTVAGTNTTIDPWVTGNSSTDLGGVAYTPSTSGGQTIYFQFQYRIL